MLIRMVAVMLEGQAIPSIGAPEPLEWFQFCGKMPPPREETETETATAPARKVPIPSRDSAFMSSVHPVREVDHHVSSAAMHLCQVKKGSWL